ncbi:TPA: DUF2283 domain-containing protein [Bacillus cereus]
MFVQKNKKVSYDTEHDVLYIFFGDPRIAYEDEVSPGVFLRKDDDTDEVIGAIIMDYQRNSQKRMANILPFKIDFEEINRDLTN